VQSEEGSGVLDNTFENYLNKKGLTPDKVHEGTFQNENGETVEIIINDYTD
jgi:hypothetical protein